MSPLRRFGLILSVMGCGLALSRSISLRNMDNIEHPAWVWGFAGAGVVGLITYCFGAIRDGKKDMAVVWSTAMGVTLAVVALAMPPLPTKALYQQARQGDPDASYWVQLYERPGSPPWDPRPVGAQ